MWLFLKAELNILYYQLIIYNYLYRQIIVMMYCQLEKINLQWPQRLDWKSYIISEEFIQSMNVNYVKLWNAFTQAFHEVVSLKMYKVNIFSGD